MTEDAPSEVQQGYALSLHLSEARHDRDVSDSHQWGTGRTCPLYRDRDPRVYHDRPPLVPRNVNLSSWHQKPGGLLTQASPGHRKRRRRRHRRRHAHCEHALRSKRRCAACAAAADTDLVPSVVGCIWCTLLVPPLAFPLSPSGASSMF